ncbi:hypothetical protein ASG93_31700 [Paenibacillus sp. Soil787]|nr:hypothetical protein ASG93_31700 [Paenibacillus sp. Soil787]
MTDLASVETWEEFGCWWDQTVNELERAFGEHVRMSYRMEVQSMCRFIQEKTCREHPNFRSCVLLKAYTGFTPTEFKKTNS